MVKRCYSIPPPTPLLMASVGGWGRLAVLLCLPLGYPLLIGLGYLGVTSGWMPAASFSWLDLLVFMPVFGVIMLCGVVLFLLCTLFLLAGGLALFAVASEWVSDGFELDRQRKRR